MALPSEGFIPVAGSSPAVLLPIKAAKQPGWKRKSVLFRIETVELAIERRKSRNGTDVSELMQALLEAWLQTPSCKDSPS